MSFEFELVGKGRQRAYWCPRGLSCVRFAFYVWEDLEIRTSGIRVLRLALARSWFW